MIMRPGQALLLPASPVFIWSSLVGALLLDMLLNMGPLGRAAWAPDLLALTLVFWGVHQPRRIGVGVSFFFGVALDVHQGAMLGQHALAYTVLAYLGVLIHRRVLWFGLWTQALHILALMLVAHALQWLARLAAGGASAAWDLLLAPLVEALLWPLLTLLLLAPQRRAHDPDETRPI